MVEESRKAADSEQPANLEALLDEVARAAEGETGDVSLGVILDRIGRRSFGPLLLLPALIAFTPLGGIPVLPTVMAVAVILIAGQLVVGLDHFWLPQVLQRRAAEPQKVCKSTQKLRPAARFVDRLIRPRLTWLTREPFVHVAAFLCILVALTVPPLEIVPFAGSVAWGAIGLFGLALIAHDGLLALIAFAFSLGAGWTGYTTVL